MDQEQASLVGQGSWYVMPPEAFTVAVPVPAVFRTEIV
jgi:hypothetical protein